MLCPYVFLYASMIGSPTISYNNYNGTDTYTSYVNYTFNLSENLLTYNNDFSLDYANNYNYFNIEFGYLRSNVDNPISYEDYRYNISVYDNTNSKWLFNDNTLLNSDIIIDYGVEFYTVYYRFSLPYEDISDLVDINITCALSVMNDTSRTYTWSSSPRAYYSSEIDYNSAFNNGYNSGVDTENARWSTIYSQLESSYNNLLDRYNDLLNNNNSLVSLVWNIATIPFESFKQIWNVEILGLNIANFTIGLLFCGVIIWLIKKYL